MGGDIESVGRVSVPERKQILAWSFGESESRSERERENKIEGVTENQRKTTLIYNSKFYSENQRQTM